MTTNTATFHFIEGPVLDCTQHVESHLQNYIGPITKYLSNGPGGTLDAKNIDVAIIGPTEDRPFNTICTIGTSNITMNAPSPKLSHIELLMALPFDWDFSDPRNCWPVFWLRDLTWYIYEHGTWLGMDHTIPNGGPVGPGIKMSGMLITIPILAPVEFGLGLDFDEKCIRFMSVIPIFEEEMNFILEHGADAIYDKFERHHVSELFDPHRKNVCAA